jgi:hypothetical protein
MRGGQIGQIEVVILARRDGQVGQMDLSDLKDNK